jgi:hypothetical protein
MAEIAEAKLTPFASTAIAQVTLDQLASQRNACLRDIEEHKFRADRSVPEAPATAQGLLAAAEAQISAKLLTMGVQAQSIQAS